MKKLFFLLIIIGGLFFIAEPHVNAYHDLEEADDGRAPGYRMRTVEGGCPGGGDYKRCSPENNQTCGISAQTVC